MSEDSQASFPLSVRNALRQTYGLRCVFCPTYLPTGGGQFVHLIDQSSRGLQVHMNSFSKLSVWVSCLRIFKGAL